MRLLGDEEVYGMSKGPKPNVAAKGQIDLRLSSFGSPLAHLSDEERGQLISERAKSHGDDYQAKLERTGEIIRLMNPLNVLAHYAYHDLVPRPDRLNERERLQQHNVELLQAL
jgi:hypothetical protein